MSATDQLLIEDLILNNQKNLTDGNASGLKNN